MSGELFPTAFTSPRFRPRFSFHFCLFLSKGWHLVTRCWLRLVLPPMSRVNNVLARNSYILNLTGRLVTVSVRTNEIVAGLSAIDEVEHPSNWPATWSLQ
jgi:hypothetical protein